MNILPASLKSQVKTSKSSTKPKERPNVAGTLAAIGVSQIAPVAVSPVGVLAINGMVKQSKSLNKDEVKIVNEAADKVVSKLTNLGKKGVEIIDYKNLGPKTDMPEIVHEVIDPLYATAKGRNAAFLTEGCLGVAKNSVIVNKDKLPLATFHELGHAYNFNNSAFWKSMQSLRNPGIILASAAALIPAVTKDSVAKEGEELTTGQKIKNGLRKFAPAIAVAGMLPTLSEEAMASIRGGKWANKLLDKNLAKKVTKGNAIAGCSYVAATAGLALGAFAAKKIKDGFVAKRENNQNSN